MGLLDNSDILRDPDFAAPYGSVQLIRSKQVIGTDGVATYVENPAVPLSCVIQPAGLTQQQKADLSNVTASVNVWTTTRLNTVTENYEADQILWQGKRYMVMVVEDWTAFGAGFIRATCELRTMEGPRLRGGP